MSHSNQLRAISALDHYLATASPQEERPVQLDNSIGFYVEDDPRELLQRLLGHVRQRLGLRNGYGERKNTSEKSEDVESITGDDLYFVNQAMPVVLNHIALIDDRSLLEKLVLSPVMPEAYKAKLRERVRQLIQAERAELDQQLGGLGQ